MRGFKNFIFQLLAISAFLLTSCERKTDPDLANGNGPVISEQTRYINNWIFDGMHEVYLWADQIPPGLDPEASADPREFFHSFLHEIDRFSWIHDDYETLMGQYYGVQESIGYSLAFGRLGSSDSVFAIVEYVYRGSPADSAGLRRGDIILELNDRPLTTRNYLSLYEQKSYIITLGEVSMDGISPTSKKYLLQARVMAEDPSVFWDVLEVDGHKVGYLAYVSYTSGQSDEYLHTLNTVFQDFAAEGITDLILDLRYNPGGDLEAAGWLASGICPGVNVQNRDIMIRFQWNARFTDYFTRTEGKESENLQFRFPPNPNNLDLDRIFIFTTDRTASASEFNITALFPYMEVITIGDTTYGKYTGAWIIPDLADPPRHNWAMVPTVMKYANAEGYSEFNDGLPPDYAADPFFFPLKPFGDRQDPFTAQALSIITGQPLSGFLKSETRARQIQWLDAPVDEFKRNLYLDPDIQ
jgi:C-terminal processing protease CtpA/Prc